MTRGCGCAASPGEQGSPCRRERTQERGRPVAEMDDRLGVGAVSAPTQWGQVAQANAPVALVDAPKIRRIRAIAAPNVATMTNGRSADASGARPRSASQCGVPRAAATDGQGQEGKCQEENRGDKVDDRDAGGRSPARDEAADNTLEQDRAESCRREQARPYPDARCPERGHRRRRRERDDREGDDAMGIFDEGLPTPGEAASSRYTAANRCHIRIRPGANAPDSLWRSGQVWRGPWRAPTGTTESSGGLEVLGRMIAGRLSCFR